MKWQVLGQVRTWDGETWSPVPADKQRYLLAIMLMRPGQVLDREWLIDVLWNGHHPTSAAQLLTHYVWRLRRLPAVRDAGLRTIPTGYQLDAAAADMDHHRFGELFNDARTVARQGEAARAVDRLTRALALWHGPALADCRDLPVLDETARRLDQHRIEARECLAAALIDAGRHTEALADLEDLTTAEAYRELPWRLLMLALYRAGRRPDALDAYQRLRRVWADQLGLEPGEALRHLHQRILAGDAATEAGALAVGPPSAAPVRPRQLPSSHPHFVGRTAELAELTRLADRSDGGETVIVAVIGAGGIGKTALAVRWSHQVADRFPDGQLYANLRGFDPGGNPTDPGAVVRGFLAALEVPPKRIPADPDAQVALYRSLLADRRVLVVLDNARDAQQVRPLLPGTPGCVAVVTSRDQLTGLVAGEGAFPVILDLMSIVEARALLAGHLGAGRVGADGHADDVIELCAHLPLALAIVAARAATDPALAFGALADEMRRTRDRLDTFTTGDALMDVRAVFSWSYDGLTEPAARLFRLLGLHPGPDITAPVAASLAGISSTQARRLLDELARAHLVTEQHALRYTLHDLLRAYATELVRAASTAGEPDDDVRAAEHRMLDHYLHTAYAADRLLHPARNPIDLDPARPGTMPERFTDRERALAWMGTEHPAVIAAAGRAADGGWDTHTWQLAWTLSTFLFGRALWPEKLRLDRAAVAATQRLGDRTAEAVVHRSLARTFTDLGRYRDADASLRHVLDLCQQAGNLSGSAHTHYSLADLAWRQGNGAEALDHAQAALDLFRAGEDRQGQGLALNALGWYRTLVGDHERALDSCRQALAIVEELDDRYGQASTLDSLGHVHHSLGQHVDAVDCYRRAIDVFRSLGHRTGEADALHHLGDTYHAVDKVEGARQAWHRALAIFDEIGHADAPAVRKKLADL